jgi:FkbM family methyltransferase
MTMALPLHRLAKYILRAPEILVAQRQTGTAPALLRRYLHLGEPQYPYRVRLRNGLSLSLASGIEVEVFWHIFVRRCYRLPRTCGTVLDCGANIGLFAVWAALERPKARVIALEPFPETFASLQQNVRENGLSSRVQCERLGLAGTSGIRRMEQAAESPTRRMLLDEESTCGETLAVECATLAGCLDSFGLARLDLLKMDIEGSEWEVLLSTPASVLARIGHVQLEYHEVHERFGRRPEQLFDHLASAGLRLLSRREDRMGTGIASFSRQP